MIDGTRIARACFLGLALLLAGRLLLMLYLPLANPTEGRYASSALDMVMRGEYMQHRIIMQGEWIPFLGKPPLGMWVQALSMELLGPSEFSARLPLFAAGIAFLWLLFLTARALHGRAAGWTTAFVGGTSMFIFGTTGLCMLDLLVALGVAAVIAATVLRDHPSEARRRWLWRYAPFVALSFGMLVKGPFAVVCALAPVGLFMIAARRFDLLRGWPWIGGTLLFVALTLPWFLIREAEFPGFIRYYFVEEHFTRFLDPTWVDRYGKPHLQSFGETWRDWLGAWVPWPLLFLAQPRAAWHALRERLRGRSDWSRLFLAAALFPPLLFTAAKSVTPTYILPAVVGVALLLGPLLAELLAGNGSGARRRTGLLTLPFAALLAYGCWEAIRQDLPVWLPAVTFAVALAFALLCWRAIRREQKLAIFALVPLGWVLGAWMLVTVCERTFTPFFGIRPAAATALARVASDQKLIVARRFDDAMGYYAYQRTEFIAAFDLPEFERRVRDDRRDVYFIRPKYFDEVPPTLVPKLEFLEAIGPYGIYTDRP